MKLSLSRYWSKTKNSPLTVFADSLAADVADPVDRNTRALKNLARLACSPFDRSLFDHFAIILGQTFDVDYVALLLPHYTDHALFRTISIFSHGQLAPNIDLSRADSPLSQVYLAKQSLFIEDKVCEAFPDDGLLKEISADAFYGLPLIATNGQVCGLLALVHSSPLVLTDADIELLNIFAARIGSELSQYIASKKLLEEKSRAEAAARDKAAFLANMSHEIRTPMSGILGITELALETKLDSVQRDYLATVRDSSYMLLDIINDILDFSKIEAGKIVLHSSTFSLRNLVQRQCDLISKRALDKGVQLSANIPSNIGEYFLGDEVRLGQVLMNLIGNAIKFTPENGKVEISIELVHESEQGDEIRFTITDSGIGIPRKKLDLIFEPFTQADSSTTKDFGGTGLGLSIARTLVELMGGTIWADSTEGVGSSFNFTTLLKRAAAPIVSSQANLSTHTRDVVGNKMKVLLAEDSPVNQKLAMHLLEKNGCEVTLAQNGKDAVDLYLKQSAESPFDIVLMDCQMPIQNGYEAATAIRKHEREKSQHTPIIALTAHVSEEDKQRCLDAGMDDHLGKPFKRAQLEAILNTWRNRFSSN